MLSGWKTIIVGAGIAVIPALTQYVGAIDWSFLGETGGMIASGVAMIVMRLITSSPVFQKKQ